MHPSAGSIGMGHRLIQGRAMVKILGGDKGRFRGIWNLRSAGGRVESVAGAQRQIQGWAQGPRCGGAQRLNGTVTQGPMQMWTRGDREQHSSPYRITDLGEEPPIQHKRGSQGTGLHAVRTPPLAIPAANGEF